MYFNTTTMKVMQYFFDNPYNHIHLRELSRTTKISNFSTKNIVDKLVNQQILHETKQGNQRIFQANMENQFFKQLKIAFSIKNIQDSTLIQYLKETIPAISNITLYGSTAQGTDSKISDIDILIIGQKTTIDTSRYEKTLQKEINLLIMKWSEWRIHATQDRAFYREIIKNGISLFGDKPVIE